MPPTLDHPASDRLVIVMVGLPARGKTYTARKLSRYLRWQGRAARVFNVGNYRRERLGAQQPADFFDPTNPEGVAARRAMAEAALKDMLGWLQAGGEVGLYDATNSTKARRRWVRETCEAAGCRVLFVESVCDDPAVLDHTIRETKLRSPDYRDVDPDQAVADFKRRIAMYERAYEPVDEPDASWVRIIDAGRQLQVHRLTGYLPSRIVPFLMNLHLSPRRIWLTRHGESLFNVQDRIGGNAGLTARGRAYGRALKQFFDRQNVPDLVVWTSTLRRTRETAAELGRSFRPWKPLDEIDAGVYDGWTYAEVRDQAPEEFAERGADKLRYRYPRGESYLDVLQRLDPVLIELERQRRPVLVIAHNAVIRSLYAYFADESAEQVPQIDIPLNTLIELTPRAYGSAETRHTLIP
ncbi:MAG: fructose-2,6-bisphosphatase [Deltaproteobacteria bacterium]|nr:MAG: fructose-2,6-bisphosphatase [Deltaproteobacteria bacterium]